MGATVYMIVVLVVAVAIPRKVYGMGELQCFDDWCITVVSASRNSDSVVVALRLSSRAKRVPQGEKGTVGYVVDQEGHRYDSVPQEKEIAFDTKLQPGESLITPRHFIVSQSVGALDLVYAHEDGFPIGSLIIGENEWFHGPPIVRISK
jgi:hypothetical protein